MSRSENSLVQKELSLPPRRIRSAHKEAPECGQRWVEVVDTGAARENRSGSHMRPLLCHATQHKTSTGNIKHSPRKLNDVARLIAGKPIDAAILQMQMSDKRIASTKIKSMLALARDHATMKGLKREELVVREAWVSKGVYLRRLDIKGRGRHGIRMKPEWVAAKSDETRRSRSSPAHAHAHARIHLLTLQGAHARHSRTGAVESRAEAKGV